MPEKAIIDTSSLIALEKIDCLSLLCKIYAEIIVPEAVVKEFGTLNLSCRSKGNVEGGLANLLAETVNLGRGEAEAIALATSTGLPIILDDAKARKVAETLGLRITGTIGILLKAEQIGIIDHAFNKVIELRDRGFYVSDELLDKISRQDY